MPRKSLPAAPPGRRSWKSEFIADIASRQSRTAVTNSDYSLTERRKAPIRMLYLAFASFRAEPKALAGQLR
jgi:hypothetical protein